MSDLSQKLRDAAQRELGIFHLAKSLSKQQDKDSTYKELFVLINARDEVLRRAAEEYLEHFAASQAKYLTCSIHRFAVGSVGDSGNMFPWQFLALLRKLKHPDAVVRFQRDLESKDKVFQLYGLLGISETDPIAFKKALTRFLNDRSTVYTMDGCVVSQRSMSEVASEIAKGSYRKTLVWSAKRILFTEPETKKL